MKQLLLLFFGLFLLETAYGQLPVLQPGGGQAVRTVGTIGRGLRSAQEAQDLKREREEAAIRYADLVARGDTFFVHREYERALASYNEALTIRNDPYPQER